jgi:1-acyl-sn-glycerol-3-phosphate acyltransferase
MEIYSKISDKHYWFILLKIWVDFAHNWLFNKRVYKNGEENLPKNEAMLLVGNHQNALMDAYAFSCPRKWEPVLVARADVFSKPLFAKMLMRLRVLPVFRMRDGKENLQNNEEIFTKATEILKKKRIFGLFPEASHLGMRRLRLFQKGYSRIAFKAEEESDFKLGLKIIPIGINYSNYFEYRSTMVINYGKPIEIADLEETYKRSPNEAHKIVKERVEKEFRPLIIDIQNEDYYETFDKMREIYSSKMLKTLNLKKKNHANQFIADKKLIPILDECNVKNPELIKELDTDNKEYTKLLIKKGLKNSLIATKKSWILHLIRTFAIILSFPLFIYGIINNFIPFKIPKLITRKIKDRNFHTSFDFTLGVFLFPIYHFILFVLAWIFIDIWWFKWIYILTLFPSGIFSFWYWKMLKNNILTWKYYFSFNNIDMQNMRNLYSKIIERMDKIVENFKVSESMSFS